MKRVSLAIVVIFPVVCVSAQTIETSSAIFMDSVPLFIESSLFAKSAPNKGEFIFHSERIKVSIPQGKNFIFSDVLIQQTKRSINSLFLLQTEFNVFFENGSTLLWKPLPKNKILIDTNLPSHSAIIIKFRIRGRQTILQQTKLTRTDWIPEITAYRYSNISDSLNSKLTAKAIYEDSRLQNGFSLSRENLLKIPASKNVEIAIVNRLFNKDSCVEFRIMDSATKRFSQWQRTGHLLTIVNLVAKHRYILEVRYKGDERFKSYGIVVLPLWWQTIWSVVGFILTGITIIALTIYIIARRQKRNEQHRIALGIEKYKKEQNKLDPHWLDNMFHTLLGFIRNNQNDLADEYLGKASSILRDRLINGERLLMPFKDDIKILENFISNERLKRPFNLTIHIDPILEIESIQVPPIIWQPSLENAIQHGIDTDYTIDILFFKKENDLRIEIRNKGEFKLHQVNNGKGYGILITEERVKGWNMANPANRIYFNLKQIGNEVVACFIFKDWLA